MTIQALRAEYKAVVEEARQALAPIFDPRHKEFERRLRALRRKITPLVVRQRVGAANTLRIALAIHKAKDDYQGSWVETDPITHIGKYTKELEACFRSAVIEFRLDRSLWYLLSLAEHWSNDTAYWADSIIANTFADDYEEQQDCVSMDSD